MTPIVGTVPGTIYWVLALVLAAKAIRAADAGS